MTPVTDASPLIYDGALVGSKATRDPGPLTTAARLVDELVAAATG